MLKCEFNVNKLYNDIEYVIERRKDYNIKDNKDTLYKRDYGWNKDKTKWNYILFIDNVLIIINKLSSNNKINKYYIEQ